MKNSIVKNELLEMFQQEYSYNEKNKLKRNKTKQKYFTDIDLFRPFLPGSIGNKIGTNSLNNLSTQNPELTLQLNLLYNTDINDISFSDISKDTFTEQIAEGFSLMKTNKLRDKSYNKISNVPFKFILPGTTTEADYRYFVEADIIHFKDYSLAILPVSWWNSPTYKKVVFNPLVANGLAGIYYHGDKSVFPGIDSTIQTCTVLLIKNYKGPIRYVDLDRKIDTMVDITNFNFIPKLLDIDTPDILSKLISANGFKIKNSAHGDIKGPNKQKEAPIEQKLSAWSSRQSKNDVTVLDRIGEYAKGNHENALIYTDSITAKNSIFYNERTCCFRYNFSGPLKSVVNKPKEWVTSIGVWNIRPYADTPLAQNQTNQILTGPVNSYILSCVKYFSGSFNHDIEKQMVDVPDSLKFKKQWSPEDEVAAPEFNLSREQQKNVLDHYEKTSNK